MGEKLRDRKPASHNICEVNGWPGGTALLILHLLNAAPNPIFSPILSLISLNRQLSCRADRGWPHKSHKERQSRASFGIPATQAAALQQGFRLLTAPSA